MALRFPPLTFTVWGRDIFTTEEQERKLRYSVSYVFELEIEYSSRGGSILESNYAAAAAAGVGQVRGQIVLQCARDRPLLSCPL